MNIQQLRYLCAVAEAGSFSTAARRAFVTQPTLSAAIAALEAEIGTELFERRRRGVVTTAAGDRAVAHARAVLREVEQLRTLSTERPARPLRLGVLPTVPGALLNRVWRALSHHDPTQPWVMEQASSKALDSRLASGRYALILTALPTRAPTGRRQQALLDDRQVLAIARTLAPDGDIGPEFLHGYPLIVRTHCEQLQAASRILDRHGVKPVVVYRTDNDERALALVAGEVGACLLPSSFSHPAVRFFEPAGVELRRSLGLQWRADQAPAAIAEFVA